MDIQKTKSTIFPKPSLQEWEDKAKRSLKGRALTFINTETYEGIELKALYHRNSREIVKEWPGIAPYTRGTKPLGYRQKPWLTAQPITSKDLKGMMQDLQESIDRGQNCISVSMNHLLLLKEDELLNFIQEIVQNNLSIWIDSEGGQNALFTKLFKLPDEIKIKLNGSVVEDPILEGVSCGKKMRDEKTYFKKWFNSIEEIDSSFPHLKTIFIKSPIVHNAGGSHVQELAISLAVASEYLQYGIEAGVSAEKIASKMVFAYSIDSFFFMNVAKLRAARRLWSLMGQEFTTNPDVFKMFIHSETSSVTATLYDEHVNLLRSANQAFAAVIGGTDSMQIKTFNCATNITTPLSERLSRNIHLILQQETLIDKVIDPAGGSFYVETLTDEIAEQAWKLFLEIENKGGILSVLQSGWIQENILDVLRVKKENIAIRKERLIGTNVYPNLEDQVQVAPFNRVKITLPYEATSILGLEKVRLAEEFEKLRLHSEQFKQENGHLPKVGLIELGTLKDFKGRADFVKGFLGTGGLEAIEQSCSSVEEALSFIGETKLRYYVLCGSDFYYEEYAISWINKILAENNELVFYIAGKQEEQLEKVLLSAGVKDFIHLNSNAVQMLKEILIDRQVM